ncbi:MAG: 3'-5' exonuclease domain-containing protein 2 [Bacteroidales bacterium]|nr:3'-5' exonuclease domain-containing protein 2 [Bacteroidales bacterium]MBD5235664.1 3'-5' exonuclease domain-containing protein 2 [Barnesiella sp.]
MLGISKDAIAELPQAAFPGRIIMINSPLDCRKAIKYLMTQPVIGFDTETRPSFHKGNPHKVSLLQLSTADQCFLIRLNHTGLTPEIKELMETESVRKVGLSIKDDIHSLSALQPINPGNIIELQTFVKDYEIADNSLQKVYAIIFNERISKGQRLTNWEAETLTEAQQAYAALDAYACLKIYNYLTGGHFNPADSPYKIETAE